MNVYVAMINDRHTDPTAVLFTKHEDAIGYARQTAHNLSRGHGYDVSEIPGWLFYASYSPEGDSVWVVETELRERWEP
jgi:hypothetical protein